jgi:HAMP domain-containing protein
MGPRVPLHIKLVVSYLLVVGLVLLPTLVYVRGRLSQDEVHRAREELALEAHAIAERLAESPPSEVAARTRLLLATFPGRLTVVDADGDVLGDSVQRRRPLPNHADRPEIQQALRNGLASSVRLSATTGQETLYVAQRFPREGTAQGVVRLSRPMAMVDAAREDVTAILRNAAAAALTAAVLLALVAALVASRPLRRIAEAAQKLAEGEFGYPLEVRSNDEIGEVAQAIDSLAAQLKSKLLASGADRATLQALLDDLPVGVVLYDAARQPERVNEVARSLCDLAPHNEVVRGAELPRLIAQRGAVERVLRDGTTETLPLALPWKPDAALFARWTAIYATDGTRALGLVVFDRAAERRLEEARGHLAAAATRLMEAAAVAESDTLAAQLLRAAEEATATVQLPPPEPDAVRPVAVGALLRAALDPYTSLAVAAGVELVRAVPDADGAVPVAEADDRALRGVRAMTLRVVDAVRVGGRATLRVSPQEGAVRLGWRGPLGEIDTEPVAAWVRPLGGDAGVTRAEGWSEAWIDLPRA